MIKNFSQQKFYNLLEKKLPYEKTMEQDLSNILRQEFILSKIRNFQGSLLDIGCSSGFYGRYYKNGPYLGLDIAKEAIKTARKKVPQGKFFVGDAQNLHFLPQNSVDNILCSEVIEHLLEPEQALKEFFRVIKPNGKILITCPNFFLPRPTWVKSPLHELHGLNKEFFHTAYRPHELAEMVQEVGFEVLEFGMLEKEAAIMNLIIYLPFKILELLGKILGNKTIVAFNFWWMRQFQLRLYWLIKKIKLDCLLRINLGPISWMYTRSYVLAQNPKGEEK